MGSTGEVLVAKGFVLVPQAMAMTYSSESDVAVCATLVSAGSAMERGRRGAAMDFTDEDRRQARAGRSKKNTKQ